ncbi:MAG: M20/M25/M40 family metallo-hydrolase [Chitinophagaceae bacterium]
MYAHYDVQPVKETKWAIPLFAAKVENGKLVGRGASDDKIGVMIPFGQWKQFSDSIPSILMALIGSVQSGFSVKIADIDAHSGLFGGKTPNAAMAIAQIISSLSNKDGSVAVESFYDKVLPVIMEER